MKFLQEKAAETTKQKEVKRKKPKSGPFFPTPSLRVVSTALYAIEKKSKTCARMTR
jgi:hypothetical protein